MKKRAKQYSREYIAKAVELADQSELSVAQVARDLGVQYATLYAWMTKAGKTKNRVETAPSPTPATPESAMQVELERLRRELEEVKKERDFLKKAAAFFAQQNK
jgi:transposase